MFQIEILKKIAKHCEIKENEPMSLHTTFRIGGMADIYIETNDTQDFINIVRYLKNEKCKYFIIGNGSNLLVNDDGYRGVIVSTKIRKNANIINKTNYNSFNNTFITLLDDVFLCSTGNDKVIDFFIKNGYINDNDIETIAAKNIVYAGSGVLLSKLAYIIGENGFTGFEFASGIPGTLGGAIAMNAGAYGGEIKDAIIGVRVITNSGDIEILNKDKLQMSYRNSIIQKEHMVVLDALFAFESGNKKQILEKMKELNEKRRQKQPLEYASAGSTFKRPDGYFAAKLIQDCNLKGYRFGDIMVSEKHSGFIVNVGNGTFTQAINVINHVKDEVKNHFGVEMELEVKIIE